MTDPFAKHNRALMRKRGGLVPVKIGSEIFEVEAIFSQAVLERPVGNVRVKGPAWQLDVMQAELVKFGEICIKQGTCLEIDGMSFKVVSIDPDIKGMIRYLMSKG